MVEDVPWGRVLRSRSQFPYVHPQIGEDSKEPQKTASLDLDGGVCRVPIYHMPARLKTGGLAIRRTFWFSVGIGGGSGHWKSQQGAPLSISIHAEKAMPQSMTDAGTGHWALDVDKRQGQASTSSRHAATRHKGPRHGAGRLAPAGVSISLQPSAIHIY